MIRAIALAGAMLMAGTSMQAQAGDGVVGGLFGAGAGALIGGAVTGKAGGAVAGALLGGATGAIVDSQSGPRRARPRGEYFTSRHRCFFEYPDGQVVQVASHPC